ncbi:hypothetical protein BH18THE2_BH18THE2_30250 [soil metagenome]
MVRTIAPLSFVLYYKPLRGIKNHHMNWLQSDTDRDREPHFIRKNVAPLTGSEVELLSDKTIQKFICFTPKDTKSVEHYTIGHLLGATDNQIPFTVDIEKLLHYHVGVFAFTGSGKSNLTSLVIRKAMNSIQNVKFVIFDISSEYGINILDLLRSLPSRVVMTEPLPDRVTSTQRKV